MTSHPQRERQARGLLVVWLVLMALTIGSFWLADVQAAPGAATATWVLGIALLKGHLVAGAFMDLVHAPRVWALAMSGFLVALVALLVALFS